MDKPLGRRRHLRLLGGPESKEGYKGWSVYKLFWPKCRSDGPNAGAPVISPSDAGTRVGPRDGIEALRRPGEYHVPGRTATDWKTSSRLTARGVREALGAVPETAHYLWTALFFLVGIGMGHVSAGLKHVTDGLRLESLEKAQELCDTEVLRCEVQRQRDNEAYFRECVK